MRVEPKNLEDLFLAEVVAVDSAVQRAVKHALRTHESASRPISSWENGEVVIIPPDRIENLVRTLERPGRPDWAMAVFGVVIGGILHAALTSDTVVQLIRVAGEAFRWLVNL